MYTLGTHSTQAMNKTYFNGLDGLRAIAALLVILGHVEYVKRDLFIPDIDPNSFGIFAHLFNIGSISVTFFFVLSGFLITYLMLTEEEQNQTINVKKFYLRRILKIWPLYFLITSIGLTYVYNTRGFEGYGLAIIFHLLILPNFVLFMPSLTNKSNPLGPQSWSIGVEEQFYLIWPLIVRKKTVLGITIFIISSFFVLRLTNFLLLKHDMMPPEWLSLTNKITFTNRIDSMAIGGLVAYYLFTKGKIRLHSFIKFAYTIGLIILLLNGIRIYSLGQHFVYSILFAALIYMIVCSENKTFLDHPILKYLGKISYGIYMWHIIVIHLVIRSLMAVFPDFDYSKAQNNILIYTLSILLTILISALSFSTFELRFLNLKKKIE